ncbi:MAG: hypothetical protein IPO01_19625 [Chitinophagaceae bacterium]|nr:hypothetical protein [Chitinophagaceae bacterium]
MVYLMLLKLQEPIPDNNGKPDGFVDAVAMDYMIVTNWEADYCLPVLI